MSYQLALVEDSITIDEGWKSEIWRLALADCLPTSFHAKSISGGGSALINKKHQIAAPSGTVLRDAWSTLPTHGCKMFALFGDTFLLIYLFSVLQANFSLGGLHFLYLKCIKKLQSLTGKALKINGGKTLAFIFVTFGSLTDGWALWPPHSRCSINAHWMELNWIVLSDSEPFHMIVFSPFYPTVVIDTSDDIGVHIYF